MAEITGKTAMNVILGLLKVKCHISYQASNANASMLKTQSTRIEQA